MFGRRITVETRREGLLTDERLAECLGVDKEHHVLIGIRELIARLQEQQLMEAGNVTLPEEQRMAAMNGFSGLEDFRILVEKWRTAGTQAKK